MKHATDIEDDVIRSIINPKSVRILAYVRQARGPVDATQVSRGVESTYSHTVKTINRHEDLGLVTRRQKGRSKYIELTETNSKDPERISGREMAELCAQILDGIRGVE